MKLSSRTNRDHRKMTRSRSGFTLTELLVVILIIVLLSAATLPAILPALNSRRVSEGSRILQSELARARDAAVRANAPRGFRLVPDPVQIIQDPNNPTGPAIPELKRTCSRLLPIEPAPDYSEGLMQRMGRNPILDFPPPMGSGPLNLETIANAAVFTALSTSTPPYVTTLLQANQLLIVHEVKFVNQMIGGIPIQLPSPPTSWYWNIRQGDKIQISESGKYYTVVGPMRIGPTVNPGLAAPDSTITNPERYINFGSPSTYPTGPGTANYEFLILADGQDDNGNGFTDECLDGVDNDGDGLIDPGFNGDDDNLDGMNDDFAEIFFHRNSDLSPAYPGTLDASGANTFPGPFLSEFEHEDFVGRFDRTKNDPKSYSIARRPIPSEGAREILLPTNVVIDLTTSFSSLSERSRVPFELATGFVDILVAPNGQVLNASAGTNLAPLVNFPFYHFWLSERDDATEPFPTSLNLGFRLPMPKGTGGDPRIGVASYPATLPTLKGERRLLSINTRTAAITSTAIETFYLNNPSYPFEAAEAGVKDVQP